MKIRITALVGILAFVFLGTACSQESAEPEPPVSSQAEDPSTSDDAKEAADEAWDATKEGAQKTADKAGDDAKEKGKEEWEEATD